MTTPAGDYPARHRYVGTTALRYVARRAATVKWRREQHALEALIAALPAGSRVLDVPFGPGRFVDVYARAAHRVCGIDISADMLREGRVAAAGGPAVALVRAEAEALPLRDRSVDDVVCTRFLNWLPPAATERVVAEVVRVARRGAIVQIRVATPVSRRAALGRAVDPSRWTAARVRSRLRALARCWGGRGRRATGYVLPRAEEIAGLFVRHGLVVESVQTLGSRLLYLRGERHELRVYRLRTGAGSVAA